MGDREHAYAARIVWDGNRGQGTRGYAGYGREYRVLVDGKPDLAGSADPAFRGDAHRHNPEDLLVASVSACHMLFYLSLCAREGIAVVSYEDDAEGTLRMEPDGGGRFQQVTLRPRVAVEDAEHVPRAETLHATAHERCFIARSCNFPVLHEATVRAG